MTQLLVLIGILFSSLLPVSLNSECTQESKQIESFYFEINDTVGCNVTLFEGNKYLIELSFQIADDMVYTTYLSSGGYILEKNEINMHDYTTGMLMKGLLTNNQTLVFTESFYFLKEKTLEKSLYQTEYFESFKNSQYIKKKMNEFLIKNLRSFILPIGNYVNQQESKVIRLQMNNFSYEIIGFPIMKGKWEMKNNVITIQDECIKKTFYLLYDGEKLETMLLPGDIDSEILIKIN